MNTKETRGRKLFWTKEKCLKSAKKYNFISDWQNGEPGAWHSAYKKGWLDECREHMDRIRVDKQFWTKQECLEDANKHKTKNEWSTSSPSAYNAAYRYGWLKKCCQHMDDTLTIEKCIALTKQYKTKKEWQRTSRLSYAFAKKHNIIRICSSHMVVSTFYNLQDCKNQAKNFDKRNKWLLGHPGTYYAAWKKGWLELCCRHMTTTRSKKQSWTFIICKADAKKYSTKSEWYRNSKSAYDAAIRKGWFLECTVHMKLKQKGPKQPIRKYRS